MSQNVTYDYIPLAMINALAYCARRFGYEFIQSEMLINSHIVEGLLRHQGVDLGGTVWAGQAVQQRRAYVWSDRLQIAGFCDLVELQGATLYPVEYKKGRPGRWRSDHAQLCAQALCLEERTGQSIAQGYLFYWATRRREEVLFTAELRSEVEQLVVEAHQLAAAGILPPPTSHTAKCRDCSLQPLCMPTELRQLAGAERWEQQL
jgi:CRISPR-associated exonuclease Cas4